MIQSATEETPVQEEDYNRTIQSPIEPTSENGSDEQRSGEANTVEANASESGDQHQHSQADWQELDIRWEELTSPQNIALVALTGGCTKAEAARMAGVHRNTLYRWLSDLTFSEALSRAREELRDAAQARLHAMADQAAQCVEQAMQRGDARTAIQLIKMLGTLDHKSPANSYDKPQPSPIALNTPPEDPSDDAAWIARRREQEFKRIDAARQANPGAAVFCTAKISGAFAKFFLGLWSLLCRSAVSAWAGCVHVGTFCRQSVSRRVAARQSFKRCSAARAIASRLGSQLENQSRRAEKAHQRMRRFADVFVPCFAPLRRAIGYVEYVLFVAPGCRAT